MQAVSNFKPTIKTLLYNPTHLTCYKACLGRPRADDSFVTANTLSRLVLRVAGLAVHLHVQI